MFSAALLTTSSMLCILLSIQPKQIASSTASSYFNPFLVDLFF